MHKRTGIAKLKQLSLKIGGVVVPEPTDVAILFKNALVLLVENSIKTILSPMNDVSYPQKNKWKDHNMFSSLINSTKVLEVLFFPKWGKLLGYDASALKF